MDSSTRLNQGVRNTKTLPHASDAGKQRQDLEPYDPTLARYKRDVLPPENNHGLCEVCRTIDFGALWLMDRASYLDAAPAGKTGSAPRMPSLFRFPVPWPSEPDGCFLCRMYISHPSAENPAHPKHLSLWLTRALSDEDEVLELLINVDLGGHVWFSLAPPEYVSNIARPIRPFLDLEWLSHQLSASEEIVQASSASSLALTLVDCETLRIVRPTPVVPYVALSYVIGYTTEDDQPQKVPELQIEHVPLAVRDAISFTLAIGQRYLWVDRYCIILENKEMRRKQLNSMADIYAGAWLTLVSVEQDQYRGILGIGVPRSNFFSKLTVDGLLSYELPSVADCAERSKYGRRGWVYQECLLSSRLLFALSGGAVFADKYRCVLEGRNYTCMPHKRVSIYNEGWFEYNRPLTMVHGKKVYEGGLERFKQLFEEYTRRTLSHETDALDAFRGILQSLPWKSYWGVTCFAQPCDIVQGFLQGLL